MTRAPGPATTTSSITDTAGLLSYRVSSVLDTSALHSAPVALHRFYHDAILHHVRTVERYRRGSLAGTLDPSISLECHFSPTASRTLFSTRFHPSASARHLRLAEEGFQRALRLDPMSVGALCGLGRLRSLYSSSVGGGGVGAPMGEALGEPIGSRIPSWFPFRDAAEQSHTGPGGGAADPCSYFRAALQAAASRQVSALSACTSRAGCLYAMEPIWCSYAAYWMSEECWRIAPVKEAFSVTPGATAVYASVAKWLRRSLQLYPRNDWALTSLGLLYFEPSVSLHPHLMRDETEGARSVVTIGSDLDLAEMSRLRGLALLQRALAINPTNTWALWGVGTYGKSTPGRDACQRLLRHLIVKSIRRP
ncbi:hypothetical protein JKF63_05306 [Porcisia hertigi]|uniref:Uncharacterized protein n=1 Tax=Porcisia hertigi TaxID=2761500 RepID=A0A836LFR3_9TRYP|nr:hypothetical protein JKF63_05306 [Porcisia hertigi]